MYRTCRYFRGSNLVVLEQEHHEQDQHEHKGVEVAKEGLSTLVEQVVKRAQEQLALLPSGNPAISSASSVT